MLRRIRPDDPWLAGRRPFLQLLAEAAVRHDARLEVEPRYGHIGQVVGADWVRPFFGNSLGLNSDASMRLAADKQYTSQWLSAAGLPTVKGIAVAAPRYGRQLASKTTEVASALPDQATIDAVVSQLGYPLIVKPNTGSEGRGICRPSTKEQLEYDLRRLFEHEDMVRIERVVPGNDHRLVVLDRRVRLAYRRDPAYVVGDGERSVTSLIDTLVTEMKARHRGPRLEATSSALQRHLAHQGLDLHSVPPAGMRVTLLPNANLSTGGQATDLTGALPSSVEALAVAATTALGLRVAGVDVLAADLAMGGEDAVVLEVNSAPGLDFYASAGATERDRALTLVCDMLSS